MALSLGGNGVTGLLSRLAGADGCGVFRNGITEVLFPKSLLRFRRTGNCVSLLVLANYADVRLASDSLVCYFRSYTCSHIQYVSNEDGVATQVPQNGSIMQQAVLKCTFTNIIVNIGYNLVK